MDSKTNGVVNAVNMTLKVVVSLLWAGGAILAFSAGQPIAGVLAVLYLVYLWVFGGRWLIY